MGIEDGLREAEYGTREAKNIFCRLQNHEKCKKDFLQIAKYTCGWRRRLGSIEDGRREAEYGTREAAVCIEPLEKGEQIYMKQFLEEHNLSKNNIKSDKKLIDSVCDE